MVNSQFSPMQNSSLPYWLALLALFVASYGGFKWYQVAKFERERNAGGIVLDDAPPLESFELTERSGKPFRSAEMLGKVWVATFFYSTCPGSCTRLNANIQDLTKIPSLHDVTWVSITVDPENDTLPVLRDYADRYGADPDHWLFCRGDLAYVRRVGRDIFRVDDVYYKGHKDYAIVVDRQGKVRGMFDATRTSQCLLLKQLLEECLAEPAEVPALSKSLKDAA